MHEHDLPARLMVLLKTQLISRLPVPWEFFDESHLLKRQKALRLVMTCPSRARVEVMAYHCATTRGVTVKLSVSTPSTQVHQPPVFMLTTSRLVNVFVGFFVSSLTRSEFFTTSGLVKAVGDVDRLLFTNIDDADELNVLHYVRTRDVGGLGTEVLDVVTFNHDGIIKSIIRSGPDNDNVFFRLRLQGTAGNFLYSPERQCLLWVDPREQVEPFTQRGWSVNVQSLNDACCDFVLSKRQL